MRFHLALALAPVDHYVPLAKEAEACGFAGVAVPDGLFYPEQVSAPYPYTTDGARFWTPETPFADPWVVIAAMAAVTERVEFTTMVLKLPLRHPLLLAKTIGTVACLAPGRVNAGVGLSWMPEEFRYLGLDFATRGRRTDEMIEALRALLTPGWVEHHGEFFDFGPLTMPPAPVQPVPVLVGGMTAPALRRAARVGDGWLATPAPLDRLEHLLGELAAARKDAGTADREFRVFAMPTPDNGADRETYRRMADLGVDDVIVQPWFDPQAPVAHKAAGLRWFAEHLAPAGA